MELIYILVGLGFAIPITKYLVDREWMELGNWNNPIPLMRKEVRYITMTERDFLDLQPEEFRFSEKRIFNRRKQPKLFLS